MNKTVLYRGDGSREWFTEVFVCDIPGRVCDAPGRTIPMKIFQPLFNAFDQLREWNIDALHRSRLTTSFIEKIRPDVLYINYGLEKCYQKQTDTVKEKCRFDISEFTYQCIRSIVFEESGNKCMASLDMLEEFVNLPDTGVVEENLVAVMALLLWKSSHAGLSDHIQGLQNSPHKEMREAASVFTNLLHPLVHTFREIFPESQPMLYSTRRRCTFKQINRLKHDLASSEKHEVSTRSTSLMSLSTSYAFCERWAYREDMGYADWPMILTIQIQNTELPMFVPVFEYVREDFEKEYIKEHEVLLLPGVQMIFRNIQPAEVPPTRKVPTTADVEIVGIDVSNILTQQEIAISDSIVSVVMSTLEL